MLLVKLRKSLSPAQRYDRIVDMFGLCGKCIEYMLKAHEWKTLVLCVTWMLGGLTDTLSDYGESVHAVDFIFILRK